MNQPNIGWMNRAAIKKKAMADGAHDSFMRAIIVLAQVGVTGKRVTMMQWMSGLPLKSSSQIFLLTPCWMVDSGADRYRNPKKQPRRKTWMMMIKLPISSMHVQGQAVESLQ